MGDGEEVESEGPVETVPFTVRGRTYQRPAHAPTRFPQPVSPKRGWSESPVSFGVGGRIMCTLAALIPVTGMVATGDVFFFFLTIGTLPLGIWFLRDTWRRN